MRALDYTHRVATLGMQRPRAELTALAAKAEARALAAHRQVAAAMAGGEEALTALLLDPSNPPRQGFHWTRAAAMYREAAAMAAERRINLMAMAAHGGRRYQARVARHAERVAAREAARTRAATRDLFAGWGATGEADGGAAWGAPFGPGDLMIASPLCGSPSLSTARGGRGSTRGA